MKRIILALVVTLALLAMVVPVAVFAAEGTITCTVSVTTVSVTVSDGDVVYGGVALEETKSTLDLADTQTVTNTGNVGEDFTIKSSDATRAGGTTWELVTGTPGSEEFRHEFSTDGGSNWTAMPATNDFTALASNVAPTGSASLDLRITMPAGTIDYGQHSINVTVMAVEAAEQQACVDNDGDGYGAGEGCLGPDCNDGNADIHPGALEICDGLDNDCNPASVDGSEDPLVDIICDGPDSDLCKEGVSSCVAGALTCNDNTGAILDLCNGMDDDCDPASADGSEDPSVGTPCDGADSDLCKEGTSSCVAGALTCNDNTGAILDLCNGLDDDCDPASTDGSEDPMVGEMCDGPDSDLCAEGVWVCAGGVLTCNDNTGSILDLCNGMDDDCDPASADGSEDPMVGTPCDGPDSDLCAEGVVVCTGGTLTCSDMTGDTIEICGDAIDNDCDGSIDEGC